MTETVSTRSSRNRRVVALMAWGCLVATAFALWNARQTGSIRSVSAEPVAFILAAFTAFVGVFAWMLYNPGRRSAAESPSLFFAATATLFPPPIVGFCLMPVDSPLRWWLALGLFILCVIAVLSHVPDEFFGVPRARHTYLMPIPAFDRVEGTVLDPNASWFKLEDLSLVVADRERPSLAPRAYLQREPSRLAATTRAEVRPGSEVDDILGTDFDLGLLDDTIVDDQPSRPMKATSETSPRYSSGSSSTEQRRYRSERSQQSTVADASRPQRVLSGDQVYAVQNPESQRLRTQRQTTRPQSAGRTLNRQVRHAQTLRIEPPDSSQGTSRYAAGLAGLESPSYRTAEQPSRETSERETDAQRRSTEARERREAEEAERRRLTIEKKRETELKRAAQQRREAQQRQVQEREAQERREAEARSRQQSREREDAARREQESSVRPDSRAQHSESRSTFGSFPVPFGPAAPAAPVQGASEPAVQGPQQRLGDTVQRDRIDTNERTQRTNQPRPEADRTPRRSRYEQETSRSDSRASQATTTPVAPARKSSLKSQHEAFQRTKDEDGSELVEGVMKVHFDKGQKRANVHIPFSPPLPGMPEVECEAIGGEALRLKVPVRQSYGIRIEARRSNADDPLDADIGFAAVYTDD